MNRDLYEAIVGESIISPEAKSVLDKYDYKLKKTSADGYVIVIKLNTSTSGWDLGTKTTWDSQIIGDTTRGKYGRQWGGKWRSGATDYGNTRADRNSIDILYSGFYVEGEPSSPKFETAEEALDYLIDKIVEYIKNSPRWNKRKNEDKQSMLYKVCTKCGNKFIDRRDMGKCPECGSDEVDRETVEERKPSGKYKCKTCDKPITKWDFEKNRQTCFDCNEPDDPGARQADRYFKDVEKQRKKGMPY